MSPPLPPSDAPAPDPPPALPQAFDQIRRGLAQARARLRFNALLIFSGWLLLALCAWGLTAALSLGGPPKTAALLWFFWLTGAAALIALTVRLALWPLWALRRDEDVAERIEQALRSRQESLNDALRASVSFGHTWAEQPEGSRPLITALAQSAAQRVRLLTFSQVFPAHSARRPWALFGLSVLLGLGLHTLWPQRLHEGWRALWQPRALHDITQPLQFGPLVGDLILTIHYPTHIDRPPRVLPNASGTLQLPKGSRVQLQATTLAPARTVHLHFGDPERSDEQQPLQLEGGRQVRGEFTIERELQWRIALVDQQGRAAMEGLSRRILIEIDQPPKVKLKIPTEDLTLEDLRAVPVGFEAQDDHGLSEVNVVIALADDLDHGERVAQPAVQGSRYVAEDEVDLSIIQAEAGDRLALFVEALDNNSVDGPQRGLSEVRYITVHSPQQAHLELSERLRALVDVLLDVLADRLELDHLNPPEPNLHAAIEALQRGTDAAVGELSTLLTALADDPLTPREVHLALVGRLNALEAATRAERERLGPLTAALEQNTTAAAHTARQLNEGVIDQLEQMTILIEAMVARLALEDMAAMADEIQAARQRVRDLIEQYKKNPDDDALKARIMRDIHRLRDRMAQMKARMAALQKKLPEEFLNLEGLESGEISKGLDQSQESLDSLEKLLEEGKIDEALSALEQMEQALDELSGSLNKDMQELHEQSNPALQKALSELMDQTRDLMREQQAVSEQTEAQAREEQAQQQAFLEDQMKARLDALTEKSEELKQNLSQVDPQRLSGFLEASFDGASDRAKDLSQALKRQALAEALEMANHTNEHLDDLARSSAFAPAPASQQPAIKRSQRLGREIERELAQIIEEAYRQSNQNRDHAQMQQLAQRQQRLSEQAEQLRERLGAQAQQLPNLDEEATQRARSAARAMQQAGEQLSQARPGQARPSQQQAQSELEGLMQGLKQANQPQRADRQSGQSRQTSQEKVEIPNADDHHSPQAFRRDLLDAMKDKAPEQYREQVKRYYESLVR